MGTQDVEQQPTYVLVVEDHTAMRELIETFLDDAGYHVLTACNGEEAIRLASANTIHLVLTDVNMPGMKGNVLVQRLQEQCPTLKVVLMSGSDLESLAAHAGDRAFLRKPFSGKTLLATVAEVLSRSSSSGPDAGADPKLFSRAKCS